MPWKVATIELDLNIAPPRPSVFEQALLAQSGEWEPALPRPSQYPAPAVETLPAPVKSANQPPAEEVPAVKVEPDGKPAPPPEKKKKPPKLWSGNVQFGINGTAGNSQQLATRAAAKAKRTTPTKVGTYSLNYYTANSKGKRTDNQLIVETRHEFVDKLSRWSHYLHTMTEFDEFTAFNVRLTGDAGISYKIFDTDMLEFKVRGGAGTSREFGVPNPEFIPEGSAGLSFEFKPFERQKITGLSDMFPDVRDFHDMRIRSKLAWEIIIDRKEHLSLQLSLLDRYDSTPGGKKPNDLTYATQLVWTF